ncbi:MAG TPA: carboxypeptidase-like regulatory domain-containing protein, partial [Longimicrobiales bacterium]|nr:carboxypeptidase-like regulatory domain-containing protein [Longimicrobiales bacterium]
MRTLRSIGSVPAIFLGLALAAAPLAAQTGTVTGLVTDATNGAPLVGAQIVIAGTNIGTITNQAGRYLILSGPAGQAQVRAILIGYSQQTETVTVAAGQTVSVDFRLSYSAIQLEGIVVNTVTGREQRVRELGTNSATIDVNQIDPASVTSIADLLSARSEGVILQDVNGTTGSAQRIRIRGANSLSLSNEPLVFVDGIQFSNANTLSIGVGGQEAGRLNDINPADIANIEVVKGPAAAALYGTAAANGVLLITTKRGRAGDAEWNFYVEGGQLEDKISYPTNYLAYSIKGNGNAPFTNANGSFNTTDYAYCPNRSAAAGTCTQDGTARFNTLRDSRTSPFSTGNRARYGLSVRGGSERVTYFLSGEYQDETGVIEYNTLDKITMRANLNAAIREDVDVSVSTGYTTSTTAFNSNDNSIFSPILNGLLGEGYFVPEVAGEKPGVNRRNYGFGFNQWDNSKYFINDAVDRFTIGSTAQYRPLSWLSFNANGGLDLIDGHTYVTLQPDQLNIAESWENGFRQSDRANRFTYTFNSSSVARYAPMEELLSTTTVGVSYNQAKLERTSCYGSSLVPGTSSCGTTAALFEVDEDFEEVIQVGAYASTELAWQDRIFVAAALRGGDN